MIPDRWNSKKLREAVQSPDLFIKEMRRIPLNMRNGLEKRLLRLLSARFAKDDFSDYVNVMEEDWDNLLILDACRYDYFINHNTIDGELRQETSIASGTPEFINKTFANNSFHDTVCVSPNSKFIKHLGEEDVFYKLINDIDYSPSSVFDAGVTAQNKFDDKRIIVHFMTPHSPFIGSVGQSLKQKFKSKKPPIDKSLLRAAQHGFISDSELREAYSENVEIAIDHANRLIEELNGKTVVTADHGEMLGERVFGIKYYGHAVGLYTPGLRHVPWLEVNSGSRREVTVDDPLQADRLTDDEVTERLRDLGYRG